jgi:hypothetical protein
LWNELPADISLKTAGFTGNTMGSAIHPGMMVNREKRRDLIFVPFIFFCIIGLW